MPRKYCSVVLVLVTLVLAESANADKRIGEPFELGVGESVRIIDAGIRVGFDLILSDSRCPRRVECIWEGNAEARAWAKAPRTDRSLFRLNTNPRFPTEALVLGFIIRMLNVAPYPEDGTFIDPNTYKATMVVVRPEETTPVEAKTWGAIKDLFE